MRCQHALPWALRASALRVRSRVLRARCRCGPAVRREQVPGLGEMAKQVFFSKGLPGRISAGFLRMQSALACMHLQCLHMQSSLHIKGAFRLVGCGD
jgi:hypothetical protein